MNAKTESDTSAGVDEATIGRLREELEAATTAAFMQVRMLAATASVETRLSMASAMSVATTRLLSVAFVVVAWLCVQAAVVWWLMESGVSPAGTFSVLAILNLALAAGLHRWQTWLIGNIGLPRTWKLLRQLPATARSRNQ